MLVADVIRLRTFHEENGASSIKVTADNMELFINSSEFVIWDDANETLYGIRTNADHYTQADYPINITATTYENIQYIEGIYDKSSAADTVNKLLADGVISDKQKEILDKFVNSINSQDVVPKIPVYQSDKKTEADAYKSLATALDKINQRVYSAPYRLGANGTEDDIKAYIKLITEQAINNNTIEVKVMRKNYYMSKDSSSSNYLFYIYLATGMYHFTTRDYYTLEVTE